MEIKEIANRKLNQPSESDKSLAKEKMEKLRKEGQKMIKGMFEFIDAQGGWLDFSYRFYPGEPVRTVHITHGEIVDLPKDLVKHLNNVYKKVRKMSPQLDESGKALKMGVVERFSRTRFTPIDAF